MHRIIALSLLIPSALTAHFVGYLPLTQVSPGQLRFTQVNVATKAKKLHSSGRIHDQNRSSIAQSAALPAIKGPTDIGYVLVDSHHEYLAAKKIGDQTVPINCIDDLSNLSRADFYQTAQAKNYIYPVTLSGNVPPLPSAGWFSWATLTDDPNRLFAALTAWKCSKNSSGAIQAYKDPNASESPQYPLWIKRSWKKVAIAFIEFKMANMLYKAGLSYEYHMGSNPNSPVVAQLIEDARTILHEHPIEGLELIWPQTNREAILLVEQ